MPGRTVPVPSAKDQVDRPRRDENGKATIYEPNGTCRFCGVHKLVADLAGDDNSDWIENGHSKGSCRAVLRGWDTDQETLEAFMARCEKHDETAGDEDLKALELAQANIERELKIARDVRARAKKTSRRG